MYSNFKNILKETSLPDAFYKRNDVVTISWELLGKHLYCLSDGELTGGIIVETEAYCGETDRACHAYGGKMTKRTATMFGPAGRSYVYLCYGIHKMFNIVSNVEGKADAILIRAIEPTTGLETMLKRRNMRQMKSRLTAGPGCLTKALGIEMEMNQSELNGPVFWVTDVCFETDKKSKAYKKEELIIGPRVGIDYAGADANLPWRFRVKGNKWTSKAK